MPGTNARSIVPAGRWARAAGAGLLLGLGSLTGLAASAVGYRIGWWPFGRALAIAEWAVYAAALALVLSLIALVRSWPETRRGVWLGLFGAALSLPLVAVGLHWEVAARAYPPINDVSTDLDDPPVFWDMPSPTAYPTEHATLQRATYPELAPLVLKVPPERAHALALAAARRKGWEIVAADAGDGRIEAVDRTLVYGFKDEIAVRISASDGGSRVDMRSRSRIGRLDRGVNAKRIRRFLADLETMATAP